MLDLYHKAHHHQCIAMNPKYGYYSYLFVIMMEIMNLAEIKRTYLIIY
jgi:hypothetical protein